MYINFTKIIKMPERKDYPDRKKKVIKAFCEAFTKYTQVALVDMMFIQTN